MKKENIQSKSLRRPPIVAVLGHVDHGKTTLLDFIRKTSVVTEEHGGITQHIGAYQITFQAKNSKNKAQGEKITFIDTPGHEAFINLRRRGAKAADIAILVIAADDSVRPQTVESIKQIREAHIPMVVAVNKIDLPIANVEKVKKDLTRENVLVEDFGGDIPIVKISALKGTGIDALLETIIRISKSQDLSVRFDGPFEGIVLETKVDKARGKMASVIVKNGAFTIQTPIYMQNICVGKVRAMFDENRKILDKGEPGKPIEVLGFSQLPDVGAIITSTPQNIKKESADVKKRSSKDSLPEFLRPDSLEEQKLCILLKTDTAGSLEAILAALDKRIDVVASRIGDISEADILQAKASKACVIGFNVKADTCVEKFAKLEKVVCRTYTVIYKLLEELGEVVSGMREVVEEEELGSALIIAEFPYDALRVAGCRVISGRIARGDTVKILRGKEESGRAKVRSIRHGKEEVTKVQEGTQCGVLFDKQVDFDLKDVIIAFTKR